MDINKSFLQYLAGLISEREMSQVINFYNMGSDRHTYQVVEFFGNPVLLMDDEVIASIEDLK